MYKRSSGILMHITSLYNKDGIGTLGRESYEFVDFLINSGQKYWQILPLGPTGYGDSPYQSLSCYAGNPLLIDLDMFVNDNLLNKQDIEKKYIAVNGKIDFDRIKLSKYKLLKKAFGNVNKLYSNEINKFSLENKDWLEDYSLFMAIKDCYNGLPLKEWPIEIKNKNSDKLKSLMSNINYDIKFYEFVQYVFFKQWFKLKTYANQNGIEIIGDIPIYVSEDSSDIWANPELFLLDRNNNPEVVSGCPPDSFSPTGQLWGNPIYDWDKMEKNNFKWWVNRIKYNNKIFDVIRIDHFRGFESYWSVKADELTAENGNWEKGPNFKLFQVIKKELGEIKIIAEDLGFLTKEVIELKNKTGYPGMKILEFAFDSKEESDYLPHNYEINCFVYTGTHDNNTVMGWIKSANNLDVQKSIKYLKLTKEEGYNWGFIRGAWSSVAIVAIAQMQDFLGLDEESRMNIPSTVGGNWDWQIKENCLTKELTLKILNITNLYGRLCKDDE